MSSTWGNIVKISMFGESHGPGIGVIIDGLPAGEKIDLDEVSIQIARRSPGKNTFSSNRKENDQPSILSGLLNEHTTGTPLCAIIDNEDAKPSDYQNLSSKMRPGHADYTENVHYQGHQDSRGGGHSSGRLTAPLTFAGAVCRQILRRRGVDICAHIYSIGNINDTPFDPLNISKDLSDRLCSQTFPVINPRMESVMKTKIDAERMMQDSLGGIVECAILGLDAGVGAPIFGGIENLISSIIFGIPAVKGIEFGNGFACTKMRGSENNDDFTYVDGKVKTTTNNHGGILGGISSGMPIIFRVAIKPTPSIAAAQNTVDIYAKRNTTLAINGRHDPCIVPRVVPVVESAAAVAILNLIMQEGKL